LVAAAITARFVSVIATFACFEHAIAAHRIVGATAGFTTRARTATDSWSARFAGLTRTGSALAAPRATVCATASYCSTGTAAGLVIPVTAT
jgi:hypothetical protein